ncbi:sodium/pantothenate symporter [soil metagenome]
MRWDVLLPLFAYLLVMLGIGVYANRRLRGTAGADRSEEYYTGGRSLGWLVLVFTLLASAASAGTFVGGPGLGYELGYGWVLASLAQAPAAFLTLGVLGKKFAILARKLGSVTVTDLIRHRYGSRFVVVFLSLAIVGLLLAYMVAQFVGGARVLEATTGLDYNVVVVLFAGTVAVYTAFGGFRAVSLTDTVQGITMFVGGVVLWVAVLSRTGGAGGSTRELARSFPDLLTLPGGGDMTVPMLFSFWVLLGVPLVVLPHVAVRGMAYKDSRAMHTAMMAGPLIMTVFTLGFTAMGPVARVFFPDLQVGDLAVPRMILEVVPGWVAGGLFAAPLAAIMSTVDSMLLIVSGSIVRDLYVNYVKPEVGHDTQTRLSSAVTFGAGVVVLLLSFRPPDFLEYLVLFAIGGLEAALLWPLLLGLYWKRGNALGAGLSSVAGLATYIVTGRLFDTPFGMDPVVVSLAVGLAAYLAGVALGPPPGRDAIVKFWGTNRAVRRVLPAPGRG